MYAGNAGDSSPAPRGHPERRRVSRRVVWEYAIATPAAGRGPPFEVRITDATDEGVGFRSLRALEEGQELTLSVLSLDVKGSLIRCRVVRCAPAEGGFDVGAAVVR